MKARHSTTTWLLLLMLFLAHGVQAADNWTDVTDRFITNPNFDSNDGWTWESNSGTIGIGSGNMRIYSGWFNFQQTVSGLPRGQYRLRVQSFYRDGSSSVAYNAYNNGTESLDAYLYAGDYSTPVVSIFSEALSYNASGRCWTPDNTNYYPNGRDAAGNAFDDGLYWNTLEFQTTGNVDVTIGIRCDVSKSENYCVIDNFILEYKGEMPGEGEPNSEGWVDVTNFLLTNPYFDNNQADGWTWDSNAQSQKCDYEAMEFWYGTFHIWQDLSGLPKGKYRLSVQSYYRTGSNNDAYSAYTNGTEDITAVMYAGNTSQKLVSVYSYEFPSYVNGCWTYNSGGFWGGGITKYFPNNMESGAKAFANGAYLNTMEFQAEGSVRIGLRNNNYAADNWCLFDNFKLEYQGTIVKATSLQAIIADAEIQMGQQTVASVTILPSNALSKKVMWTSSNESVASVSADGVVTGLGPGTAVIKATTIDGSRLSSSVTVKVVRTPPTSASLVINEVMAANVDEFVSPAFNFDGWVEFYNPSDIPVTLVGCYLSDDAENLLKWRVPSSQVLPAHGYLVMWFGSDDESPINAPFKLDVDGGSIFVCDENGRLITQQAYPSAMERVSYARTTDGGSTWGLAAKATPGESNGHTTYAMQQIAAPVVNQPSKLFTGTLSVQVDIPSGTTLHYTTDGTLPTEESDVSTNGRFTVSSTSNYRFRLFADGMLPSTVTTRSYIVRDKNYSLPVVSVVSDPAFLYSSELGVMTKGPNGRPGNGQDDKCNWNMNWERPVNFSYLDSEGTMVLNQDANLEMCGGWSRAYTPHSFKLKGSKELGGTKYFPYAFFAQKPHIRNRALQIRNGGNDTSCRIIDASLQYIIETSGIDIDCQSYQPVHEFINGEYKGVLNVREPNNKHYVEANYGWDDEEIDQFEMSPDSGYVQKCGTPDVFYHLVDDLSPNAANASTYAEICQLLDIDEYINYMAAQFYLGGTDWPQNNVKGFRHRAGGKFRFVLFDLDFAFNTNDPFNSFMNKEIYTFDRLRPATLGQYKNVQIRFVTLFKNLLKNSTFRKQFIDSYCLMGGSVFRSARSTEIVNQLEAAVKPAMQLTGGSPSSSASKVRNNLNSRMSTAINALRNYSPMNLSGVTSLAVNLSSNIESARLQLNGLDIPTARFSGTLFAPAVVKASAPAGYVFKGWKNSSGTVLSTQESIDISNMGSNTLTAVYEALADDAELMADIAMPIKVNEVNAAGSVYVSETWKSSDWIELYNPTDTGLDVCGLFLSDDPDEPLKYQIDQHAIIPAGGHLVVWADGLGGGPLAGQMQQLHTNFKLSNTDGQLVLCVSSDEFVANNAAFFASHPELGAFIDGLSYKSHTGIQSVGRYPDGGKKLYVMEHPTIERTNTLTAHAQQSGEDQSFMGLLKGGFSLDLAQGWNWVSLPLEEPIGVGSLSPYASRIVGQTQEAIRDQRMGMVGTLSAMQAGQLYKVQMSQTDSYNSNAAYCRSSLPIALKPGWNWVGYPVSGTQTLAAALADFTAEEGEQLIGQDGFATYSNGRWTGSLTSLETGRGYLFHTRQAKTLTFAKPALAVNPSRAKVKGKVARLYGVDKHAYPNVMGIVATIESEGAPVEPGRYTLLAYVDDECRGAGKWVGDQVYLTVYGERGETLKCFALDESDGTLYAVDTQLTFAAGIDGTPQSPRLFNITDAEPSAIGHLATIAHTTAVEGYYSLSGQRMTGRAASLKPGIYIVKHQDGTCRKVQIK